MSAVNTHCLTSRPLETCHQGSPGQQQLVPGCPPSPVCEAPFLYASGEPGSPVLPPWSPSWFHGPWLPSACPQVKQQPQTRGLPGWRRSLPASLKSCEHQGLAVTRRDFSKETRGDSETTTHFHLK